MRKLSIFGLGCLLLLTSFECAAGGLEAKDASPGLTGQDSSGKPAQKLAVNQGEFADPDLLEPKRPLTLRKQEGAVIEYRKANRFFLQGNYPEAYLSFHQFLKNFPAFNSHTPEVLVKLGSIHLEAKEIDLAGKFFRKVLQTYSHKAIPALTADAVYGLGEIALYDDQVAKALYYYRFVLEHYPNTPAYAKAEQKLIDLEQAF